VYLHLRSPTDEASIIDILDRILDKGIVPDPSVRLLLSGIDLCSAKFRIVVAPERRRRPFIIPRLPRRILVPDLRILKSENHRAE